MDDSEVDVDARALKATRLVWAALVVGTVAMAVAAELVARTTTPLPVEARPLARVFAVLAAVLTSVGAFVIPRLLPMRDDLTPAMWHRQRTALGAAAAQLGAITCLVLYLATHDATDACFALAPFAALLFLFPTARGLEAVHRRRRR